MTNIGYFRELCAVTIVAYPSLSSRYESGQNYSPAAGAGREAALSLRRQPAVLFPFLFLCEDLRFRHSSLFFQDTSARL